MAEKPKTPESAQADVNQRAADQTDPVGETLIGPDPASEHATVAGRGMPADSKELVGEFGRYRILRLLGQGAMGAVYLAEDSQLSRQVALKVPHFTDSSPPNLIERFYREARSAGTLTHPNICPVYDVGEISGQHFISMGYIEGRPLSAYIESGKKQPEKQVAGVIRKLALGLQEAHDHGIIHRDLKPANIMIDRRNEPIVMDFGLAGHTEDRGEAKLTKDGTVIGSPAYMSPEQVGAAGPLGPASDIYSLGVVMYELLTGQTPFQGGVISVIGQIVNSSPKSPSVLRSDLSSQIEAICMKAMAKSADNRFGSMSEFASVLRSYVEGDDEALKTSGIIAGAPAPLAELSKRQEEATALLKSGQLRKAVEAMETLADDPVAKTTEIGEWARSELPETRVQLEKAVEESRSLLRRARKSLNNHDYDRAIQLLDQIPADLENNAVIDLKAEATELSEEVEELTVEITEAIRTGRTRDMMATVERMLELKPKHRQANELYEKLASQTERKRPRKRKGRRKKQFQIPLPLFIAGSVAVLLLAGAYAAGWFDGSEPAVASSNTSPDHSTGGFRDPDEPSQGGRHEPRDDELKGFLSELDRQRGERPRLPGRADSPKEAFEKADRNDDGHIDPSEAPPYLLSRADADQDDAVTYPEFLEAFGKFGVDLFRPPASDRQKNGRFRSGTILESKPERETE